MIHGKRPDVKRWTFDQMLSLAMYEHRIARRSITPITTPDVLTHANALLTLDAKRDSFDTMYEAARKVLIARRNKRSERKRIARKVLLEGKSIAGLMCELPNDTDSKRTAKHREHTHLVTGTANAGNVAKGAVKRHWRGENGSNRKVTSKRKVIEVSAARITEAQRYNLASIHTD